APEHETDFMLSSDMNLLHELKRRNAIRLLVPPSAAPRPGPSLTFGGSIHRLACDRTPDLR
ncbi:MAG: hypothetical protein ACREGL_00265, partial [Alphaproteobacteria bacterium]